MTKQLLSRWAGSQEELIMCSFYFWSAGTKLQKSQEGLLRSVLFQVLRSDPSLAQVIVSKPCNPLTDGIDITVEPWHLSILQRAMNRLLGHATGKRFCFFIDGLDEYDGDLSNLLSFLQNGRQSLHIKFCVSSRPRNVLRDSLDTASETLLCLEDFTAEDMRKSVTESLNACPSFRQLDKSGWAAKGVVKTAVTKAQGVFLWVSRHVRRYISLSPPPRQVRGAPHSEIIPGMALVIFQRDLTRVIWQPPPFWTHALIANGTLYTGVFSLLFGDPRCTVVYKHAVGPPLIRG